jgi:hypothetical protein
MVARGTLANHRVDASKGTSWSPNRVELAADDDLIDMGRLLISTSNWYCVNNMF